MTGAVPGGRAARARFVRCVALVGVLAGLLLLPCADGMMPAPSMSSVTTIGCVHQVTATEEMPAACATQDAPSSGDPVSVVAACMVLLIVVLATVIGLRPSVYRLVARLLARGRPARRGIDVRAPSLSQLCLLRT